MMSSKTAKQIGYIFTVILALGVITIPLYAVDHQPGTANSSSIFTGYDAPQVVSAPASTDASSKISAVLEPAKDKQGFNPLDSTTLGEGKPSSWLQPLTVENNRFTLVEGRSHFMKFSTRLSRISVSNPAILDFITLTSTEILLNAKTNGSVDLIVWDAKGAMASFEINVIKDPGLLDQLLKNIDPKGKFEIFPSKNVFVVRGSTTTVQKQKFIDDAVKSFAPGSVSLVKVWAIRQILLQCRFVQIDHERNHELGFDMESITDRPGRGTWLQRFLPGASNGANAVSGDGDDSKYTGDFAEFKGIMTYNDEDTYQMVFMNGDQAISTFLKAVEEEQIGKIIARPNLLAKDGEEANFVVGGERAIAVTTNNEISVQYKEFGTKLKFKPEINEDDTISLAIEPEVSDTSDALGITLDGSNIPGFTKTSVKTQVQLADGETLLLGGMIQQKLDTSDSGVPFLRRLPILGKAFENSSKNWHETELLIIVTPRIVQPEKQMMNRQSKNDALEMATAYEKASIPVDDHADAIKYYLEHNRRWVDKEEIKKTLYPKKESPTAAPSRSSLQSALPEAKAKELKVTPLFSKPLDKSNSLALNNYKSPAVSSKTASPVTNSYKSWSSTTPSYSPGVSKVNATPKPSAVSSKGSEIKKSSTIPPVTPSGWKKESDSSYHSELFDSSNPSSSVKKS